MNPSPSNPVPAALDHPTVPVCQADVLTPPADLWPTLPPAADSKDRTLNSSEITGNLPTVASPVAEGMRSLVPGYEILEELGRGGMGVVYKARQIRLNRLVALKMILSGGQANSADRLRFLGEAEAIAAVHHPGIVEVYEFGTHQGQPYFALEFCPNGSLTALLDGKPLVSERAASLAERIARAVQAAHQRGIIHRDLKPANILLAEDGSPKVTDFGLAKRVEGGSGITQTGAIMGTPSYMAPEQALGQKDVGKPADVYALGAILYQLLTGRPPFQGANVMDTLSQVIQQDPVPPRHLQPKTPPDLEVICLKCLHKIPGRRYSSAAELADDLQRYLAREPIQARPASWVEKAWKLARRRPAVTALAGVSLLAAVVLLVMGILFTRNLKVERDNAEAARSEAVAMLQRSKAYQYCIGIGLAQRELEANNLPRAEKVLADCNPEFRGWEHHYLLKRCQKKKEALAARSAPVRSLCFSPDGRLLATANMDWTVKLWDVGTGMLHHRFLGHTDTVAAVCFSPDGKLLASGANDRTIRLWDVETGQQVHVLQGHSDRIWDVCFSPDGQLLASASEDQLVKLWDVPTGEIRRDLKGHTEPVRGVCFSSDGLALASAGEDKWVRYWDPHTGAEKGSPTKNHKGKVVGVCYSRDGRRLATASQDGTIWIGDPTGQDGITLTPERRGGGIRAICLSPDPAGKWVAGACASGSVKVWDVQTGAELHTLEGHAGGGFGVCFSPDGRSLASGNADGAVQIWDAATGREMLLLEESMPRSGALRLSPDGEWLASTVGSTEVHLWSALDNRHRFTLEGHAGEVWSVCFSPDSRLLATAGEDKIIEVWDVSKGEKRLTLKGHTGTVFSVTFSPDGKWLASASKDGTVKLWDAQTGKLHSSLEGHAGAVLSVCFSPDGHWLASGGENRAVKLWDVRAGREAHTLAGHGGHTGLVNGLCFSPDGARLASASTDDTIKVWDLHEDREPQTLKGHLDTVWSVCFLSDGQRLASVSADKTLRVWDLKTCQEAVRHRLDASELWDVCRDEKTGQLLALGHKDEVPKAWEGHLGKEVHILKRAPQEIKSICFSQDGNYLASTNNDRARQNVRLWDREERHLSRGYGGHDRGVLSVCISPDGLCLAAGGEDKVITVWKVLTGEETLALKGHTDTIFRVCFSPDGKWLASASKDGTVKLWDAGTGELIRSLGDQAGWVRNICFSPDSKQLASAKEDKVELWHVQSSALKNTLSGHGGPVFAVCFSLDGRRLASGSGDGTARLWDVETGKVVVTLSSTSTLFSLCFSPDGRRLASGNREGIVQIWDTKTGLETLKIKKHPSEVWSVCFSPDGSTLASASQTLEVWLAGADK